MQPARSKHGDTQTEPLPGVRQRRGNHEHGVQRGVADVRLPVVPPRRDQTDARSAGRAGRAGRNSNRIAGDCDDAGDNVDSVADTVDSG